MSVDQSHPGASADDDAYAALLLDYVVGALTPAEALVVRVHTAMRPDAMRSVATAESLGGALLESIEPVGMTSACLPRGRGRARRHADRADTSLQRVALAASAPEALRWGWLAPGIRRHRLPVAGASLLRVAPGRAAPRHDHEGQELTLVLRGALIDEAGSHRPGDIVFAGPGCDHAPLAGAEQDCVCLISMSGAWRLADFGQRIAARLFAS